MSFDLVITQPVLYASPTVDITDDVLAKLNAAK
jgi:Skp family chaperone for outer membrane proteins